jgi:hypothetical protein
MLIAFLLWLLLLIVCWPIVWLLLLPFRLLGIAVDGVLELIRGVVTLPGRVLRGRPKTKEA